MVMKVKLQYYRDHDSTTVVAVKNQVQLKKLRIAKFIQKWNCRKKKKNLKMLQINLLIDESHNL